MIGSSLQVYRGVVDLLRAKWAALAHAHLALPDLALPALRSQLLMALHDRQATELCAAEPIHKARGGAAAASATLAEGAAGCVASDARACVQLVWTLDACLRDKAISAARLAELRAFFDAHAAPAERSGSKKRRKGREEDAESQGGASGPRRPLPPRLHPHPHLPRSSRPHARAARSHGTHELHGGTASAVSLHCTPSPPTPLTPLTRPSAGAGTEDARRTLADAAMVLRDPPLLSLLAFEVIRRLYAPISRARTLPRDDPETVLLVRLLQLAAAAQSLARGPARGAEGLPPADEGVLGVLLPTLTGFIVDVRVQQVKGQGFAGHGTGIVGGAENREGGSRVRERSNAGALCSAVTC